MKIARIEVFQVILPYSGRTYYLSAGREYTHFDATIVRIETECGIEGWGESTPFGSNFVAAHAHGVRAGIDEMANHLLGYNPCHVDRFNDRMDELLTGHLHAKTALDVACWDIFGKKTGMAVCDLLGGRTQQRLPVISSIYAGEPQDMRFRVQAHRELGYLGHSIKIGAEQTEGGPKLDVERVRASLADAAQGEIFLVDANGGMSLEYALRFIRLLPNDLDFVLEAPCQTWRETLALQKRTNIPIMFDELYSDEQSVIKLIADGAAESIGMKISKNGGLTRCRRQRDIAIAAGLSISVQETVGSDIAFAALLHMGQTIPHKFLRCVLDTREMVSLQTAELPVTITQGGVMAPTTPGLGIIPDREILGDPIAIYQ